MNTINITLSNPSPDAVKVLVQELNKPQVTISPLRDYFAEVRVKNLSKLAETVYETKYARPEPSSYIFDLDGVIADNRHRLHYIDGTDEKVCKLCGYLLGKHAADRSRCPLIINGTWRGFLGDPNHTFKPKFGRNWNGYWKHMDEDTPIEANVLMLKVLAKEHSIIFVTGRPYQYFDLTEKWITKHVGITDFELWMRPLHNFKKNAELKRELVEFTLANKSVAGVFEDNPEAVTMYRSLGYTVYQIEPPAGRQEKR